MTTRCGNPECDIPMEEGPRYGPCPVPVGLCAPCTRFELAEPPAETGKDRCTRSGCWVRELKEEPESGPCLLDKEGYHSESGGGEPCPQFIVTAQPAAGQSNWLQRAFDVAKAHRIATSTRTLEAYGMVVLRADVVDAVVRTEHAWVIARGLAFPKVKDLEPYESEAALRLQLAVGRLLAQLPKEEKDDG